jgi:hypothetical protein
MQQYDTEEREELTSICTKATEEVIDQREDERYRYVLDQDSGQSSGDEKCWYADYTLSRLFVE